MIRTVILISAVCAVSMASFMPNMYYNQHEMADMQPMEEPITMFSRASAKCGPGAFVCTSPQLFTSGGQAVFPTGYSKLWLTSVGGSPAVSLMTSMGYWEGRASQDGCSTFGGYGGSGSTLRVVSGSGTVIAWACK